MSSPFEIAQAQSKQLIAKPTNDELLELYALFKVGGGENIDDTATPSTFDFKGKAKRKAWQELVDQNISADEAQKKYVTLVEDLKTKYGFDETKKPETVGTA